MFQKDSRAVPDIQSRCFMDLLARLVLRGISADDRCNDWKALANDFQYILSLSPPEIEALLALANTHHVTVRALNVLQQIAVPQGRQDVLNWCGECLTAEGSRIGKALAALEPICNALQDQAEVVVIKSLDHWPDLGSDLDLFTNAHSRTVLHVLHQEFGATPVERSWGDRLANKWNFKVPGLDELLEVHVRYLGQTGEQNALAQRLVRRRVTKRVAGHTFFVPAPEERIIISTLQRMYRHFYFRLCDMADFTSLLRSRSVDFVELERAATAGGIWAGVKAFLLLISRYVRSFGTEVELPGPILSSQSFADVNVRLEKGFLRVPKLPAASLYGQQLWQAGTNLDMRAISRLPLLPPLAISALVAYRLTGSDKGVW